MRDQEVHEIQLNGKQLVFMFMAATVVSVVIFLSGVMVGRGVRLPEADVLAAGTDQTVDPTAPFETTTSRLAPSTDPAPPAVQDSLTYAEHLEAPVAPNEPLKPAEPAPRVAPPVAEKAPPKGVAARQEEEARPQPPPQKASATQPAAAATRTPSEPAGKGWVVQVVAFPDRTDADALVRRLTAKGYQAFVTLNEGGPASGRYRVRVGKYPSKREADVVSARLQQEERFKPWVTR